MTLLPYLTTLWETISPDLVALFNESLPHNIPYSNLYISPNEEEDLNYTLPFQRFRISLDVDSCEGMPWCNTETDLCVANEGLDFPKHGVYKAGGQGSDTDPSYCRVDHLIHQTGKMWLRLTQGSNPHNAWSSRTATPTWVHFRFPVPPTGSPDRLKIKLDSRYQNNLWGGNPCGYPVENGSLQLGNQCLEDLDSFGWRETYNPCGVTYDENHCEPCVAQPWDHLSPPGFWLLWSTGGEKTWHITGPYNEMNATEKIHDWLVDVPEVFHGASGIDVVFFTYSQYPVRAEYPNNFPRDITEVNPKWDLLTGLYRKQNGGGDWQCFQKASQSFLTLTSIETIELETRSRLNFPQSPQFERPRLFGSNWNSIQNQYMNLSCGEPNINYAGLGGLLNVRQGFEKLAFGGSECDDDFPNTIEDISLAAPYYRNDIAEINEISMDDRYRVLWLIRYLNYCDGEMYCDYFYSEDVATLTSNFLNHEVSRFDTYDFVGWWGLEYDLQTSRDMKFWCVIVDAFSDLIGADQLTHIKSKLRLVIQEFMNLFTNSHWALFNGNNWTPVLCVGAVYWAVTFWHEDYELAQDVLHSAIDSMYLHFDMYLIDGVYVEGVAEYSFMSINGIIEMDNVFEPAFGMHFPAVPWSRLKNMFNWYLDSMASDGHLVDFGDSHSKRGWSVITPLFVAYLDEILENKEADVDPCLLREYFTNQYYGLRSLSIIHPFIAKEWAPIVRQCNQGDTPFRVGLYPEGKFGYARWKSTVELPPDPALVDISSQITDSYLAVHARPATFPHSEVDFSTFIYSAFGNRYITDLAYGYWANLNDLGVFDNSVRGCNALQVIDAHGVVSDGQYHGQFRGETGSIELLHDDRSYFKMNGSNVYGKYRETGWLDSMERLFVPLDDGAFLLVDSFITKESRGALTIEEYFYTFVDEEKQDMDLASRDQYTCDQQDRVNQHTIIDVLSTSMIQLSPVCSRLESHVSTDRSIFVSGTSLNGGHFLKDNIVRYPVVWEDPEDDSTWTGRRGRFRWVGSDQMTSDVRAFIFAKSKSTVEITSAASKVIISVSVDGNVETFEFPSGVSQILSAVDPCPRWCGTNAQPWSEKCRKFNQCKVCSMCDTLETDTDEPTLEPTSRLLTAAPTFEPTTNDMKTPTADPTTRRNTGVCASWCRKNGNPWSRKCFEFANCSGCDECDQFDNTREPTLEPTEERETDEPTLEPTEEKETDEPTLEPTVEKETDEPTLEPTVERETDEPTLEPTVERETDEPTLEPTVPCVAWCARLGASWESKCTWSACKGCDECFEESEEPEDDGVCVDWCATSSVGWNEGKCKWTRCEGCSECKPVTLVPTGEPTLEPEEPSFAPTGEPTLEPEDSADSGGCTRCVELVEDFRKCNKEVTMNGSPRASSSDECGPEALKQCIQQNSKAECARAEVYFSFRKVDENDESGACIYSSADQCGVTDSVTGIRTNHQWQIYTYNCCDQSEETAEPTAEPTKEPEETEEPRETPQCPGWCGTHGAPWSTKCSFRACEVCVRCTS